VVWKVLAVLAILAMLIVAAAYVMTQGHAIGPLAS